MGEQTAVAGRELQVRCRASAGGEISAAVEELQVAGREGGVLAGSSISMFSSPLLSLTKNAFANICNLIMAGRIEPPGGILLCSCLRSFEVKQSLSSLLQSEEEY